MNTAEEGTFRRGPEAALVSIVVPVYNGAQYLRESLESILGQTYRNIEVLVMDDASTDATPEIIASYGNRVLHVRQSQNRGIYGNANDGIERARGQFIAVYHSDDIYDRRIVESEVAFLDRYSEAGAVFCSDVFVDKQGREFGRLKLPPEIQGGLPLEYPVVFNALLTYKNSFLCCPTVMVRTSVHRAVGVYRDQEFRNTSDLDMWLRIGRRFRIGILEEHLLRYRRGHGSSSERYHRLRTEPERFFTIMDRYLASGDREIATTTALSAYEAHRAADRLKVAAHNYILGRRRDGRSILNRVHPRHLLSPRLDYRRDKVTLYFMLQALLRAPRVPAIADLLYQHWYPEQRALLQGGAIGARGPVAHRTFDR